MAISPHIIRPGNTGIQSSPHYASITPSASQLPFRTRAILIGGAGNLVVTSPTDSTNVTIPVIAGQCVPLQTDFILAATTATGITALY